MPGVGSRPARRRRRPAAPAAPAPADAARHLHLRGRRPARSVPESARARYGRRAATERGEGVAGLTLGEISVRGVMQSRGALIAMIQGPDNKTYMVHAGDKLADGVVKSVTPQGLIVLQDIHDPLSSQKQREVRKLLRSLEGAKE